MRDRSSTSRQQRKPSSCARSKQTRGLEKGMRKCGGGWTWLCPQLEPRTVVEILEGQAVTLHGKVVTPPAEEPASELHVWRPGPRDESSPLSQQRILLRPKTLVHILLDLNGKCRLQRGSDLQ